MGDNAFTLKKLTQDINQRLAPHYGPGEAAALMREIFLRVKGYNPVDIVLKADMEVSDYLVDKVNKITERLLLDEPVQYIFGVAHFYGMDFKVSPAVLIPRPETAELVDIIVNDFKGKQDLHVFDICTGSGVIAIALARNLPFSVVEAIDISDEALSIASENSSKLKTKVRFAHRDALSLPIPDKPSFNIIVCNPPYISEKEKPAIEPNVLLYEPHDALFVPDSDPLVFYRAVARYALKALLPGGKLYFEINPLFSEELKKMLIADGWTDVRIIRDSYGKLRFAEAIKQS